MKAKKIFLDTGPNLHVLAFDRMSADMPLPEHVVDHQVVWLTVLKKLRLRDQARY